MTRSENVFRADLRTLWLLGDPVGHSMSPLIQNTAIEKLQEKLERVDIQLPVTNLVHFPSPEAEISSNRSTIPHKFSLQETKNARRLSPKAECPHALVYVASKVLAENFESVVRALPLLGAVGANVTVPHKMRAFELCDSLSERARAMRAVNTLHFRDGEIYGDNTDGIGWWNSVKHDFAESKFLRAVVIGAGGAARAVCHTLLSQGVKEVVLLNRTEANAAALASELPAEAKVRLESLQSFSSHLGPQTLVVQTTSVGLKGDATPVELPTQWPETCSLSELIYGRETALLRRVRELGGQASDGLGMLCGQAAESLALWTGRAVEEIPFEAMMQAARERIHG